MVKLKRAKPIKAPFTFEECNDIIGYLEFYIKNTTNCSHSKEEYIRGLISRFQSEKEYLIQAGVIPR